MTMTNRSGSATTTRGATTAPRSGKGSLVERIRARRAASNAHAQLARELSTYSTPAERLELDAMLARHDDAEVADIHRILDRRSA